MPRKAAPVKLPEQVSDVVTVRVRVVGGSSVFGHEPGSVAVLTLRQPQLDALIQAGAVAAEPVLEPRIGFHKKGKGDNAAPDTKEGESK